MDANPSFAKIRYKDGTEANVNIKDLAPAGGDALSQSSNDILQNDNEKTNLENESPEVEIANERNDIPLTVNGYCLYFSKVLYSHNYGILFTISNIISIYKTLNGSATQ